MATAFSFSMQKYVTPRSGGALVNRSTMSKTWKQLSNIASSSVLQMEKQSEGISVETGSSKVDSDLTSSPSLHRPPLIICGPSGVGKGTIISKYMKDYNGSEKFGFSVSHTTRKPRPGEVDGLHYHFVPSETQMKHDIDSGKFLEYAQVHGNWYGTSFSSLKNVQLDGKACLMDIDVQGAQNIKQNHPKLDANFIFIAPPSFSVLKDRLANRGTETEETLQRRLKNAREELEYGSEDAGNFDAVVVNDDLEVACETLHGVIEKLYRAFC